MATGDEQNAQADQASSPSLAELMRGLLEGSPDPAAVISTQGRYLAFNEAYATCLGRDLSPGGRSGMDSTERESGLAEDIRQALGGKPSDRMIPVEGPPPRMLRSRLRPIRDREGAVCGALHLLADEGAPEEVGWLRLGHALELHEASASGKLARIQVFVWDASVGDLSWSGPLEAFVGALGQTPATGRSDAHMHPEDARRLVERLSDWKRAGRKEAWFDFRVVHADGSQRSMEAWARLLPGSSGGTADRLVGVSVDVSELAATERHLRESRAAYERLFDLSLDGFAVQSLEPDSMGQIVTVNEALLRMLGRSRDEIVGQALTAFAAPAEAARIEADLRVLKSSGELQHEYTLRTRDGMPVPIEASSRAFDEGGRARALSVLRNLSQRKKAEDELRARERWFRALAEALPSIVWSADEQGRVGYYNAAWDTYTGIPAEMGHGDRWTEAIHPDDLPALYRTWMQAVATGDRYEAESRVRRHDGVYRWFLNRGYPILEDGVRRWIGTSTDIDAIKAGEMALRERERWLGSIVDTIPHMVWTAGACGTIEYQSRQLVEFVGETVPGEDDLPWARVFHPDDVSRARSMWRRMLASGQGDHNELRLRRHDGVFRWFDVAAAPLKGDDGRVIRWIGTWTDVEERKAAEELLRESDRRKDEFLAILSHELRNPLAPIRNGLAILERAPAGSPEWRRSLLIIRRQSDQLTRLVDDLLDLTRINRGKIRLQPEIVDVVALASRCVDDHADTFAQRGVALALHAPPTPLHVCGDPIRIAQALGNLLQNAAKFTPRNGEAHVTIRKSGTSVELVVRDTGMGLAPELLPHLFEPFIQAEAGIDRSRGGLGLGLALVRGLVELHGGRVQARSAGLGRGATFSITLPVVEPPSKTTMPGVPLSAAPKRVLVIEDNADAAEIIRMMLEMDGHEVRVASDGREGVTAALGEPPDVVLCDIGLPGMDGFEVARTLSRSAQLEKTRLYALSGYATPEDARRARDAGFLALVAKPASPDQLAAAVAGTGRFAPAATQA